MVSLCRILGTPISQGAGNAEMRFPSPNTPTPGGQVNKWLNVTQEGVGVGNTRWEGEVTGGDPRPSQPTADAAAGGPGGGCQGSPELAGLGASQEGREGSACLPRRAVLIARSSSLLCFP